MGDLLKQSAFIRSSTTSIGTNNLTLSTRDQRLGPGSVGENWTIEGGNENTVCVGDTYSIGSSEVQVSGPRGPCWKQERKLKLPGFLKRTIESLRTGFYVQVAQCGTVRAGDGLGT